MADKELADLTAATSVDGTELVYIVVDPSGTQLDRKITVTNLLAGKQPLDSDLTALAALTTTSFGRAFLELANAAAGRTALGLGTAATSAVGDFDAAGAAAAAQAASQPVDSDLTAIAALTTTAYGRGLLTLANSAALASELSGTYVSLASSAVLANKYGNPGGVDDTATVAAALADLGSSGTLIFTPGTWALNLGTLGANTLTNGVRYRFVGFGPDETILQPVTATDPLFTIQGPSDTSDDIFELSNLSLAMGANRAYTDPLIVLKGTKNFLFDNVRADVSTRTGKLIQLDSAYQGMFRNMDLRTGKWVVPMEIKNSYVPAAVGVEPQMDTIGFEQVVVTGSCGPIVRTAENEIHGLRFDGLKVVSTNYYAGSSNVETTLASAASAGASSIDVTSTTGIVANDVITLDYEALDGHVEICKVASVVGTTLNLAQPLEYAHDPVSRTKDIPVMVNGFLAMLGDGIHAVSTRGCMSEGQQVGWGLGGVQSFTTDGDYSGSGEWVRVYGATFKIRIGTTHLFGTQYDNKVLFRPTYAISANDSMWRIEGPFPVDTGAAVQAPSYGDAHTSRTFQIRKTDSGLFYELWNTPTPGTAKRIEVWNNGSSVGKEYWSGQIRRDDGVRGKYLSGAGKVAAADADFVVAPDDGMVAVVRDTTTGITRLFVRSNGAWAQEIPPAADLLDAIKTVDGSGSGLDADTLDGHDTAYFEVAGAAAAAEAAAEAYAVQRANHTGTQPTSTITDFSTIVAPLRSSSGKAQNVPLYGTTTVTPTAGVLYVARITLEAKAYTTVTFGLATVSSGLTSAFFGLYDVSSLAKLASSADVAAAFQTTNGAKTATLNYTPGAAGDFYLGYLIVGGTPGTIVAQGIGNSVVLANVAPIVCSRHNTTGLTALPDPLVLMVTPSGFQLPWLRYE